ncbi:toxin [Burkholderia contaminans]|nr:toxin [Burkholderia contaminans]
MQQDASVTVQGLTLPKGGGAITGLGDTLGPVGPSGMAGLSLPLPVSTGRGYAPPLTLNYSSGAGNGPFGIGWLLALPTVRRRTNRGVPRYDNGPDDTFVGPDDEELVAERDVHGAALTTTVTRYGDKDLGATYRVTRYFPRVEGRFDRLERWQGSRTIDDFWLIHGADGQLHCLGKTAAARVANPDRPEQIAEWRIEESVNPFGEHIYYRHVAENVDGVTASNEATRDHSANRYLAEVFYGNRDAAPDLYLWDHDDAGNVGWLFSIVLDYGARGIDLDTAPPYAVPRGNTWPLRADSFSRYQDGFEVRTHRLCRQVLMFHHFPDELMQDHTLVRRLLLTYRESAVLSQLTQARLLAYESDGTVQSMPPLEMGYSPFDPDTFAGRYRILEGVAELNDSVHYQMVDLYGDGLPGVLFRHDTGWRYRPPIRRTVGTDEVGYGHWQALPAVPSMQPAQLALMDIDGDGRLDWLVTQPGMSGYFSFREGNQWSGFVPFNALPTEFFHPQAQFADLVGAGLSDLVLIGPTSVRLYANQRNGFARGTEVAHAASGALPIAGLDARELVAFSDVLGSGQPHLVRIRHNGITCWPNLGRGRFGQPVEMAALDFDAATFNPDRILLADLDGSGAADLIYVESNHLTLYLNESGNAFAAPLTLPLPDGFGFDALCRVTFADLQGIGVASLVISRPHMTPSHWRLDFASSKPYLMTSINNNMGARTAFSYRSSVQYWLDDKRANPGLTSALPMPIPTLAQVVRFDEITDNSSTQQYSYHHGVYDGVEREFRGFGLVTAQDAQQVASSVESPVPIAPPQLIKSWYHTGREADESTLPGSPYQDAAALRVGPTRLTRFDETRQDDVELGTTDPDTRRWLFRALKGALLRQETYGLDGSHLQDVPYSVSTFRYQVRQVQAKAGQGGPVALPGALEQVDYGYERISVDPMVGQQIQLRRDRYGAVTWQVNVRYPRRPKPRVNPYPDTLPATSWDSSYDDQQGSLVLTELRSRFVDLDAAQAWRLGLPSQQRSNVLIYGGDHVPDGGLNVEVLSQPGGLLDACQPRTYTGQQLTVYTVTPVDLTALVDHVETAEFDAEALAAFDGALDAASRDTLLVRSGYRLDDRLLPPADETEPQVWVAPRGYTSYEPASGFYRPRSQQTSLLAGSTMYTYDSYTCALTATTDALGNQSTARYDYRFLQPDRLVDPNGNTQEVRFDALGRVATSSFYGTEDGRNVGFAPVSTFTPEGLTIARAIEEAGKAVQQVAGIYLTDPLSWMTHLDQDALKDLTDGSPSAWNALQAHAFMTADGYLLSAGRTWAASGTPLPDLPDTVRMHIQALPRLPVQQASLVADRYPSDAAQQVLVGVGYVDGSGRALQNTQKVPAGIAWQRDAQGEIVVDQNGKPVNQTTTTRWAVSGKVEYDNKSQPVRSYQPYFIDDWRYVVDTAMRTCGYADTHFYDAIGREVQVLTAKSYLRRIAYYPWFTVVEDENDTWLPPA